MPNNCFTQHSFIHRPPIDLLKIHYFICYFLAFIHCFFLCIILYRIRIDKLNQEYLVYFAGTNTGNIYKIVQFIKYGQRHSNLLDILEIARNEPIREMGLSQKTGSLYIATEHSVKQIDLAMCNRRYDSCFRCVTDPYCGWDKEAAACKPYQLGLLQVSVFWCECDQMVTTSLWDCYFLLLIFLAVCLLKLINKYFA